MARYRRDWVVRFVCMSPVVLLGAIVVSLLQVSSSYAIIVEPVIDTVLSVTKLNESNANNGRGQSNRSENTAAPTPQASSPSFSASVPPAVAEITPPQPVIVTETLNQLSPINTTEIQPEMRPAYRPASTIAVPASMIGSTKNGVIIPLQTSNHGWKLFGLAWYWWLLGGLAVYSCVLPICRQAIQKSNLR